MGDLKFPYSICVWAIDFIGWFSRYLPSIFRFLKNAVCFAGVVSLALLIIIFAIDKFVD